MKSQKLALQMIVAALLIAILAGCSSPTPTPTLAPTLDIQKTIVAVQTGSAQTVVANLTQNAPKATATSLPTATPLPSATPLPTNTALPTATITATYIPWTATPTTAPLACVVTSFEPKLNYEIVKDSDFDATWVIKNTGKLAWTKGDIDILYSSGTKLQKFVNGMDLTKDVASGESYTASVDMHSPTTTGTYSTTWVVARGSEVICSMVITIVVK